MMKSVLAVIGLVALVGWGTLARAGIADSPLPVLVAGKQTLHLYSVPSIMSGTGLETFFGCTSSNGVPMLDTIAATIGLLDAVGFAAGSGSDSNTTVGSRTDTAIFLGAGAAVLAASAAYGYKKTSECREAEADLVRRTPVFTGAPSPFAPRAPQAPYDPWVVHAPIPAAAAPTAPQAPAAAAPTAPQAPAAPATVPATGSSPWDGATPGK